MVKDVMKRNKERRVHPGRFKGCSGAFAKEECEVGRLAVTRRKSGASKRGSESFLGIVGTILLMLEPGVFYLRGRSLRCKRRRLIHFWPRAGFLSQSKPFVAYGKSGSPSRGRWTTDGPTQSYLNVWRGRPLVRDERGMRARQVWSPDGTSIAFLISTMRCRGSDKWYNESLVTRVVVISALGGSSRSDCFL